MKVSYTWLQTYFKDPLPSAEQVADLLTFHVFEIDGMEKVGADTVLDVKVLPDRAHYALSHRGIAYELAAITKQPLLEKSVAPVSATIDDTVSVVVDDAGKCPRYLARYIKGVTVGDSPAWLSLALKNLGNRSINNIVDATNYVMLDTGQPLHAFDADKVAGSIHVRNAKAGEKMTTLDEKEVALDESVLVIADDQGSLAIAGIKGGNRAAVTASTKNLIIESANFDAGMVRKTSQKIGIRTDSSKRFENEITPLFAEFGMNAVTTLIKDLAAPQGIGPVTDNYPKSHEAWNLIVKPQAITERLGVEISEQEMIEILQRIVTSVVKNDAGLELTIPQYRLDLTSAQDIVEEVGRLYGYDKIPVGTLPETTFTPKVTKEYFYIQKIKDLLVAQGFSEVYTYSLTDSVHGSVELMNPMASDKSVLRKSLDQGLLSALELNSHNAPLLGLDEIKIFEIGTVFGRDGEHTELGFAAFIARNSKNKPQATKALLETVLQSLEQSLGTTLPRELSANDKYLINLTKVIETLATPTAYEAFEIPTSLKKFSPISRYPFIARDIAVFTPSGTTQTDVESLIKEHAGNLLVRLSLFDVFEKAFPDGTKKTSYGFRLIFQSPERTLTDEEINTVMTSITNEMNTRADWQVR
jgi:phenylalanyl-tRNA synthetase beta chain